MSIFDQNNQKENSEELLYQAIKEELKPILEEWDKKNSMIGLGMIWEDTGRTDLIKQTSKIVMQFIWRKLGLKMPDYTRRVLDDDYNILNYKEK